MLPQAVYKNTYPKAFGFVVEGKMMQDLDQQLLVFSIGEQSAQCRRLLLLSDQASVW
jgi:hypothetical protein